MLVGAAAGENAIGIQIDGDNATFVNVGDISATNAGTGVSVAGDKANISLAGGLDVGDFSTGLDVSGNNNNMTLATYELNVTGQKRRVLMFRVMAIRLKSQAAFWLIKIRKPIMRNLTSLIPQPA